MNLSPSNKKYIVANFEDFPHLFSYYIKCKEYKKKIKEIIGRSASKFNVKNVWNQWILRVLGKEKTNHHLFASKVSVEADRDETLKHIHLKPNENPEDIQETYDRIVTYCEEVHSEFNQMKVDIMQSPENLARLAEKVHIVDAHVSDPETRHTSKILHYKID